LLIYEKGHEGTQREDLTFYTADSTREMDTRFLIQEDMNSDAFDRHEHHEQCCGSLEMLVVDACCQIGSWLFEVTPVPSPLHVFTIHPSELNRTPPSIWTTLPVVE